MSNIPDIQDEETISEGTLALVKALRWGFHALKVLIVLMIVTYLAWPKPIGKVEKFKVKQARQVEANFWFSEDEDNVFSDPSKMVDNVGDNPLETGRDLYLLTGDMNIVHCKWSLVYTIDDLDKYIQWRKDRVVKDNKMDDTWKASVHRGAQAALAMALKNAILKQVSRQMVDDVIKQREVLRGLVEQELIKNVRNMNLGVAIQRVNYQQFSVPQNTVNAFRSGLKSELIKSQKIQQAKSQAEEISKEADGEADAIISNALSYRTYIVNSVQADADYIRRISESGTGILIVKYHDILEKILSQKENKMWLPSGADPWLKVKPKRKKQDERDMRGRP